MANWWFWLGVWIPGIPLWKGLFLRDTPRIPHHQSKVTFIIGRIIAKKKTRKNITCILLGRGTQQTTLYCLFKVFLANKNNESKKHDSKNTRKFFKHNENVTTPNKKKWELLGLSVRCPAPLFPNQKNSLNSDRNPVTFQYTGWLMGILTMASYNPLKTWVVFHPQRKLGFCFLDAWKG